jgi:hypothetical protein
MSKNIFNFGGLRTCTVDQKWIAKMTVYNLYFSMCRKSVSKFPPVSFHTFTFHLVEARPCSSSGENRLPRKFSWLHLGGFSVGAMQGWGTEIHIFRGMIQGPLYATETAPLAEAGISGGWGKVGRKGRVKWLYRVRSVRPSSLFSTYSRCVLRTFVT